MRASQLAFALFILALQARAETETESCRRVTSAEASLAVQHLKAGASVITWCDSCTPAGKQSPVSSVKEARVRQDGDKWEVLVNGHAVELRDLFVRLADGSFRRVASLVGCEVAAPDRVGGAFDDGKLRSEWLKKPLREGNGCDTQAALVPRLVSAQEFAVPAALTLTAVRYHPDGSEPDLASSGGRYGLSIYFADDYFEDQPTNEGALEESPKCTPRWGSGGAKHSCLSVRFNLRRRQVHMTFWFPPGELESCRLQAERVFAAMRPFL